MAASHRVVLFQTIAAIAIAVGLAPLGLNQSLAALLAGAVCIVPNAYFAWRSGVERSPARFLMQGVGKALLTVALMVAVWSSLRPAPLGFFTAFIGIQLMYVAGVAAASNRRLPEAGTQEHDPDA